MTSAGYFSRWAVEPLQHQMLSIGTQSDSFKYIDPLFSWKHIFVGEVAIVVALGGRKMPTSPVFNMVNVSVYACTGWPNYPMSSKTFPVITTHCSDTYC